MKEHEMVEQDIYSFEFREELLENDQISLEEDAFMRGFEDGKYEEE